MRRSLKRRPDGQLELWTPEPIRTSQDEMNLVEWPFAVLTETAATSKILHFSDTIRSNNKPLKRSWQVTTDTTLPTATDEIVYVALMELTREQGFQDPVVTFTRSDLCRRLGWATGGKEYKRLADSLDRLHAVRIVANNAFWDRAGKVYKTIAFHIIDEYAVGDEHTATGAALSHFRWSDVIFASLQARNIKPINMDFFLALSTPMARRLYRYLDRKRHMNREFSIDLHKLAFEHLGMSRNYKTSEIKRAMAPAHNELIERNFLDAAVFGKMVDGGPKVTYHFLVDAVPEIPLPPEPRRDTPSAILQAERKAATEDRERLDAYIEEHPEMLDQAREITRRKIPRGKDGSKAFEAAVREEARVLAREALSEC